MVGDELPAVHGHGHTAQAVVGAGLIATPLVPKWVAGFTVAFSPYRGLSGRCIHSDDGSDQYFIDPDECIDCGACVDPCPVDAIYPEDEVPEEWRGFIQINTDYFKK
jgi:NAD-dependent dihydropyrimidine dehydrogenase PreA subunit